MGGTQSAFSFRIKKSGGLAVFDVYNMSGLNTISSVVAESTTVRFYWNNRENAYVDSKTGGFEILDGTRVNEFAKINSNYYVDKPKVNSEYVEFALKSPSSSPISFVSWVTMLSIVQPGFELKCSCTASLYPITIKAISDDFKYFTMLSPGTIANNGVYYNQEGSTVYFKNDKVDVEIVSEEYENLSNDRGEYLLDVTIDDNGTVTIDDTYMPYINGVERLDESTLLIRTTISPTTLGGVIFHNVNYNGMFVRNNTMIVDVVNDGIICYDINNDMNFSILATVTTS